MLILGFHLIDWQLIQAKPNISFFPIEMMLCSSLLRLGMIEKTDRTKFLGLIIDSRLSFCYHVDFVASKIFMTIGVLYKLGSLLPSAALFSLYQCLVLPYFTYGIDSWFVTGRSRIQKLEVLQRKCIRAINFY